MGRRTRWAAAFVAAGLLACAAPAVGAQAASSAQRIDLKVLVVDDGGPSVAAIVNELDLTGTPYTRVSLSDASRPVINAAFLSGTDSAGRAEARYQAVVLPNNAPFPAGSAEMTALQSYEAQFGVRQVDAYTYAQPAVGLNWAANPGYIGALDGMQGTVTSAGLGGSFRYLKGSVPFEDNDPNVVESYGYLATPLATQAAGASFTPLVTMPIPNGGGAQGVLAGEYDHSGVSELVLTFAYNQYQQQYRLLARGIVDWMTQGIHLGYDRNYFAMHIDDVFLPDDRWSSTAKCTPGDAASACQGTPAASEIRMTPADVTYAQQWEKANNFTFDFLFNGGGSDDATQNGTVDDPLTDSLLQNKSSFRWVDHTYDHPFLGCVQNTTTVPWSCTTDASGATQWVDQQTIEDAIGNNVAWAARHGLSIDSSELVTGEHSGLKTLPQQPVDNPNLAPALAAEGVKWTGSDHSREPDQRAVGGSTLTVPRFPMNVYYNAGKVADEVDEYNWLYTAGAQGGSGICTANPATTTCLPAPLDASTGYSSYVVPLESRIDLGHILGDNPDPHYAHQSNLSEDRILYPVLNSLFATYGQLMASNTPMVNLRESAIGAELQQRSTWQSAVAAGNVTAYRVGSTVTVQAPAGVQVPVTMPTGTVQPGLLGLVSTPAGTAYAGELSGWLTPKLLQSAVTLTLNAAGTPAAAQTTATTTKTATAVAPSTVKPYQPASVARQVPLTPSGVAHLPHSGK
ncbi:hypothetical protein [Streptacidiphilus jiangxiensis]|uniref:Uncharacterized protein n=1 Tax=Streptacidiphilus jiangxiensis TaxID=235985 RepID=A0A1H7RQD2_STRJI|nr:hypothetical protein [Streptacidiphilus jiangxiensis]SEL62446.1 hypothetical protein SAMN05414137_110263 [Streptacidiphilus jiangxiensis]